LTIASLLAPAHGDKMGKILPHECAEATSLTAESGGGLSRRRVQREIERRLRELDRLDAAYGLGAAPRPRRGRDWRTIAGFVITVVLLLAVVAIVPGLVPVTVLNAFGLGPHRLGHPPVVEDAGARAFLVHQPGSSSNPVTWDPCRPIHYEVNVAGGPGDALGLVTAAISDVSRATGLRFDYDGPTDARPQWKSSSLPLLAKRRPVLVSWDTASEVPQLAGRVAGIGGALPQPARDTRLRFVSGGVTLDSAAFAVMETEPNGRALERAIVLHELGHLVGLAHVSDPTELMYADNVGQLDYGPGDLAGLAELGSGPCF
jgi:hypothetical protein